MNSRKNSKKADVDDEGANLNSQENLHFVFERDKSTIKNQYHKIDYSKKKVFPANNSLEILSSHTEPDTEMFFFYLIL